MHNTVSGVRRMCQSTLMGHTKVIHVVTLLYASALYSIEKAQFRPFIVSEQI